MHGPTYIYKKLYQNILNNYVDQFFCIALCFVPFYFISIYLCIFYFTNGGYIECLSLTYVTDKSKT